MKRAPGLQPHWPDRLAGLVGTRRRGGRRARRSRRIVAALLLLTAGVLSVTDREGPTTGLLVLAVTRDLPIGASLTTGDVTVRSDLSPPDGALRGADEAVGHQLSAPIRKGEVLTDVRLVTNGRTDPGVGRVAVPVRPADPATVDLLTPGVHVAVLAVAETGQATLLAPDAVVLSIPPPSKTEPDRRLVVLAVPTAVADRITAIGVRGDLALRFT